MQGGVAWGGGGGGKAIVGCQEAAVSALEAHAAKEARGGAGWARAVPLLRARRAGGAGRGRTPGPRRAGASRGGTRRGRQCRCAGRTRGCAAQGSPRVGTAGSGPPGSAPCRPSPCCAGSRSPCLHGPRQQRGGFGGGARRLSEAIGGSTVAAEPAAALLRSAEGGPEQGSRPEQASNRSRGWLPGAAFRPCGARQTARCSGSRPGASRCAW